MPMTVLVKEGSSPTTDKTIMPFQRQTDDLPVQGTRYVHVVKLSCSL
jgi:hypothetical protein